MKAQDHRIGNIIEYNYPNDGWGIHILLLEDYEDLENGDFRSISLNDTHLRDSGFVFDNEVYTWSLSVLLEIGDFLFELDKYSHKEGIFFNGLEVKYVHQLQNLFHAFTGVELSLSIK